MALYTQAATANWTGGGDGVSWNDPHNWSGNAVPDSTSDVSISTATSNPTIKITTTVAIGSVTSAEPISLTAGSLTLTGPSTLSAGLSVSNATLTVDGANATLSIDGTTTLTDCSLNAKNGGTASFPAVTALTRVNLSATGGGQLLFPAVQSYADGVTTNYAIQASGAGSKIDLAHLSTMAGGVNNFFGNTYLTITASGGGEVDLGGALSGNTVLVATGAASTLDVAAVSSLQDASVTASGGATIDFAALTALTHVNFTAGATGSSPSSGRILCPAAKTYTGGGTVQVSGAGSKIDLSALNSLAGGSFTASGGGELDLAGAISGSTTIAVDGASVLGIGTVTKLDGTTLNSALALTFAATTEFTDTTVTATGVTLSFPAVTALTRVNLSATGGGQLLFPAVQSYADGVTTNYAIQASGAGSKIDLAHLSTMAGGVNNFFGNTYLTITASGGGEVDLGGALSGNTVLVATGAASTLDVAAVSSLTTTTLTAGDGALWLLPASWHPQLNSGVAFTTTGSGQFVSRSTLSSFGGQFSINTSAFVNNGVLDAEKGGTITIGGSFRIDDPGILKGAIGGNLTVTGDLLGSTRNAQLFLPLDTITFKGAGTATAPQQLEAMGADLGAVSTGFVDNFAYGVLALANNTQVKLVDLSHNSTSTGAEALYAVSVVVPAGTMLDLNNLHLYARTLQVAGTIVNGTVTQVPDSGPLEFAIPTPGSISLAGELDEWTFFARAGHFLTVQVNPGGSGSPSAIEPQLQWAEVQLLDADNNVLSSGSSPGAGAAITLSNVAVPADGTYKIHVVAASGHTSSTGNYVVGAWDVTPNSYALDLNQASVGNVATQFGLDQWSFSATKGQQVRFHLASTGSANIAFKLTGPGDYVGFQDLTADSALIDLPSSGTYHVSAYGLDGATGTYSFVLQQTSVTALTPDVAYDGTWAGSGQAQLFAVPVTKTGPLSIVLTDPAGADHAEIYARFGTAPTRQTFDYAENGSGANHSLLVPSATAGTWYILVYGESIPAGAGSFDLKATSSNVVLTGSSTAKISPDVDTTIVLTGAGFNSGSKVTLVASGGASYAATASTTDLVTQITATFAAGSVPAGTYAVKVTQTDGSSSQLVDALTVQLGQAAFTAHIEVPAQIGYHIATTLYVDYANTGTAPMPAPLVTLTGTQKLIQAALLTLNPALQVSGFWTNATPAGYSHSVQILASGATPGILAPGESMRVPVYYAGWQQPWDFSYSTINFSLSVAQADDTTAIDWPSKEASLQPSGVSSGAWHVMFAGLRARMGTTSGGFVQLLDNQAAYLGRLGEHVTDVGKLWSFAVLQAEAIRPAQALAGIVDDGLPTPGDLSLSFGRAFNESIPGRFQSGPLGFGWFTPWQQSLAVASDGTVTITRGNLGQYVYQPDSRYAGQYFSQPGDHGALTAISGGYKLTAVDGTATVFHGDGTLNYVEDTNGNRITAAFAGGRLSGLTASSGQSLTLAYNTAGLISTVTDSVGRVTTYTYDAASQHLVEVKFYTGKSISYTYDTVSGSPSQHALTSITTPAGTHRYFTYDTEGRLAGTSVDGGAEAVALDYSLGRVGVTNAVGGTGYYYYNENGQLAKGVDPIGRTSFYDYDDEFNLVAVTNGLGDTATYTYNGLGQVVTATDFLGHTTDLVYAGAHNRLSALTDANGHATLYTYDTAGNLLGTTFANGRSESVAYDPLGNALSFVNAAGQPMAFAHNAAGQLTSATFADGSSYTYAYDGEGHLTSATDAAGSVVFTYDPGTRLLTKVAYPNGKSLTFGYDAGGRRISLTDQDGFKTGYHYDGAGRLASLTDVSNTTIVAYTYDKAGRLSKRTNGNGTYTTYDYCLCGELTDIVNYAPNGTINSRFDYLYDAAGRMIRQATIEGTWTYTHDATGQLTHAVFASTNTGKIPNQDLTYNYDPLGNRTSTVINGVTTTYAPNAMNQYSTVGGVTQNYDANGNLLADGINTYAYNQLNELISVTNVSGTTSYTYNALGQRVASAASGQATQYLIDPAGLGNVVGVYDGNGDLKTHYTYGRGLTSHVGGGTTAYYDFDFIGSTAGISDNTGSYRNAYSYDPFGRHLETITGVENPFQFNGAYGIEDLDGGSLWMRHRQYDSDFGRFASRDPIGFFGGDCNVYRYVGNNPTSEIDPEGLIFLNPSEIGKLPFKIYDIYDQGKTIADGYNLGINIGNGNCQESLKGLGGLVFGYLGGTLGTPLDPYLGPFGTIIAGQAGGKLGEAIGSGLGKLFCSPQTSNEIIPPRRSPSSDPTVPGNPGSSGSSATPHPMDPNALYGPSGYGPSNFLTVIGSTFAYKVTFENDPSATAPAQTVTITDSLGPNLDWSTFQLTGIGFADHTLTIPAGSQHYQTTLAVTYNGQTFNVQMEAGIHSDTGQVYATFYSLDPATGLPPANVLTGFLPPEDGTGRGQGYLTYTVSPKASTPTGTVIPNVASIVFDFSQPIATNQVDEANPGAGTDPTKEARVTADADLPTASVTALAATTNTGDFAVAWSGQDTGAGVTGYNIYVSVDGGSWTIWQDNTTAVSATYAGQPGHTYAFYATAIDGTGNVDPPPTAATTANTQTVVSADATASPLFSQQPASQTVSANGSASFAVAAVGNPTPTLRWQRAPAGSTTFADLANDASYSGTTTAALTLASATTAMSGDQFRCVATNGIAPDATSTAAILTVNKLDQTIDFAALPTRILGSTPFAVIATASSGLPVTFAVVSGPATISGGTVTLTGTGMVVLRASQVGDDAYNAASDVDQTFAVVLPDLSGSYFGTFSPGSGHWALKVYANYTATFIAYLPERSSAIVVQLNIDPAGSFSVDGTEIVPPVAGGRRAAQAVGGIASKPAAAGTYTLAGTIAADGSVSGQLAGLGVSLTGAEDTATTANAASGYYTAAALGTVSGSSDMIVGPSGQAVVVTTGAAGVDGAAGTVNAGGQLSTTTAGGSALTVSINAQAQTLSVAITPAGASKPIDYAGLGDGVTAQKRLVNISTRALSGTGNNVTIGGFVIGGTGAKQFLIRGVGPSLTNQGIGQAEVMLDPTIALHDALHGNAIIASNDNWGDNTNASDIVSVASQIGAQALAETDTKSSALLLALNPGVYSFVVNGKANTTGVVLLEVYDADTANTASRLVNISARANATTGNGVAIGGFVVSGNAPKHLLVRAVGPTLATQGLAMSEVLQDPTIAVHDALHGNAVIATNDNWGDNANAADIVTTGARIGATPFATDDTTSSALLITLQPGVYSFIAQGKNGASGIVLVEVYDAD